MFWPNETAMRRMTEVDGGSPKKVGTVVAATMPAGSSVSAGDSQPTRTPLV